MKKIKLVRVYTGNGYAYYEYNDTEIARLIPESEALEVTDEEYDLLTDYRIRDKIMRDRYGNYADKLILIEDKTQELPALIKSASDVLGEIKKKEKADKEKAAKAAEAKKKKTEEGRIKRAKELLRKAGELK